MAGQIELAHSKDIVGAGIVAGGPFACAETESGQLFPYWPIVMWQNASQATNACMKVSWGVPDAEKLAKRAKELAEDGKIDALSGLADDKVYLFSGNEDQTVQRPVVEAAKRFYAAAGVPEAERDAGREARRPRLFDRDGRHGLRPLQGALRQRLRLRPGEGDP